MNARREKVRRSAFVGLIVMGLALSGCSSNDAEVTETSTPEPVEATSTERVVVREGEEPPAEPSENAEPQASSLSDAELMALLASAPISPADQRVPLAGSTYENNIAYSENFFSGSGYRQIVTINGQVSDACAGTGPQSSEWYTAGTPLIADVNGDGVRDIVAVSDVSSCNVGASDIAVEYSTNSITAYTPTAAGDSLEILAYLPYSLSAWSEGNNLSSDYVFEALLPGGGDTQRLSNVFNNWGLREMTYENLGGTEQPGPADAILGFADGHITAQMLHGYEPLGGGPTSLWQYERRVVSFEIQGSELVPVAVQ